MRAYSASYKNTVMNKIYIVPALMELHELVTGVEFSGESYKWLKYPLIDKVKEPNKIVT